MIRYLLAIVLTVAVVGLTMQGIDHTAALNTEEVTEGELSKIEEAATSLLREEPPPRPNAPGARRHVTLSFPEDSFTMAPVNDITIRQVDVGGSDDGSSTPVPSRNISYIEYTIGGGNKGQMIVDAPIRSPSADETVTEAADGSTTHSFSLPADPELELVLWLGRDDENTVVVYIDTLSSFEGENYAE